jgi:hypothetical protein
MTPDRDMLRRWPAGPLRPRGHWSRAAGTRLRAHRAPFPGRHHRRLPPLRGWRRAGAGLCRHEPGPGPVLRLRGGRRRGAGQRRPGPRLDSRGPPALGARPRRAGQDARTRAADRAHRRRPPSPAAGGRAGRRSLSRPRRLQPRDRPPRGALRAHRPRPPRAAVGPGSLRHHRRGRAARALYQATIKEQGYRHYAEDAYADRSSRRYNLKQARTSDRLPTGSSGDRPGSWAVTSGSSDRSRSDSLGRGERQVCAGHDPHAAAVTRHHAGPPSDSPPFSTCGLLITSSRRRPGSTT